MTPKVTILMPVFNAAPFLDESIRSVLSQSYRDFELLIVDDGSSDASCEIINSFNDSRICLVRNEINSGVVHALNKGLALATGTHYIARMDADDISLPERLNRQVAFMDAHPEVGVCGTWLEAFDRHSRTIWAPPVDHETIWSSFLFESVVYHPTVIIRRDSLDNDGLLYSHQYPHAEDYELWCRLGQMCRFANIPEVLLYYRLHADSVGRLHSAIQVDSASMVRSQLLEQLGILPSDYELALHTSLSLWQYEVDINWLQAVKEWLEKLLVASRQARVYPDSAFCALLATHWYFVCLKATPLGMSIYHKFHESLILRFESISWRQNLVLLVRSLFKIA